MLTTSSARRDVAITLAVAVPMSVPFFTSPPGHVTVWGCLFNVGAVVPLIWRRRWPFGVAVTVALFATLVSLHHRPGQMLQYSALVAIYTVADLGKRWQRLAFLWAIILTFPPASLILKKNDAAEFMFTVGLPLAAYLLGTLARSNRSRALADASRAAAEERNRIARDMHDVLAHAVSVMIVQAEAGAAVVGRDPAAATRAFDTIADTGRLAEVQLSGVLGVLKGDPPPTAGAIPSLVDRVRRAGLAVDLRVSGAARALPVDADVAAFRIVQEALTNSLKHASGPASVSLDWGDDLAITVTSRGLSPGSGTGRGLIGIRERAAACGGRANAGPTPDGFRVHARLPIP
ncbi:sensor histidine kinase [Virgisporangium ochraceum]|uniref:histidine kinase n=1 Tax=Virgisporangium ochraceum TaxID=65505 RepID=A0A8J3ZP29_9ACTN|nr:histidine kinase [Virgisporangium ochraceum]GIJ65610.1 two-component sensor histidine kinase [Virgisporangium ochraceum]